MPGVSMSVSSFVRSHLSSEMQNLLRNAAPWRLSARNGRRLSAVAALPGMGVGLVPSINAAKPSVVGSGPMWMPGKSRPAR